MLHTAESTPAAAPAGPERPALVAFSFDPFEPGIGVGIAKGDAKEKVLQRFGKPAPTDRVQSTTQWESYGLTQTKFWYYDGLEIVTAQPAGTPRAWVRKITLKSSAYKLKFGLSIGTKRSEFLATLGPPYQSVRPTLIYYAEDHWSEGGVTFGSHAGVEIFFDQEDRAEKIVWWYFAD